MVHKHSENRHKNANKQIHKLAQSKAAISRNVNPVQPHGQIPHPALLPFSFRVNNGEIFGACVVKVILFSVEMHSPPALLDLPVALGMAFCSLSFRAIRKIPELTNRTVVFHSYFHGINSSFCAQRISSHYLSMYWRTLVAENPERGYLSEKCLYMVLYCYQRTCAEISISISLDWLYSVISCMSCW
jgi:hypothetical protein